MLLGALEAGGTKMVCAVGDELGNIENTLTLPTENPTATMDAMIAYFKQYPIKALGIGSFGPLDLNKKSPTYGYITSTPKLAWQNYPLAPAFQDALGVPVELDTDVNAAALAESKVGAAKGLRSCLYVTIGTGVGGGIVAEGNLVHGLVHPEFGHMLLRPLAEDPNPEGFCPFHGNCLEGMASGTAMVGRWGMEYHHYPTDHIAWKLEAGYLAQMCMNAMLSFSPEKIILGGGVMKQEHLFPAIRKETVRLLNGYVQDPVVDKGLVDYIVPSGLDGKSGIIGSFMLAAMAAGERL